MPTFLPARLGLSHSEAVAEAYASATAGVVVLTTLEIWNPSFEAPVRVVNDYRNLTATLEATAPRNPSTAVVFLAIPFKYIRQEQTADMQNSGAPAAVQIEIDNVSRQFSELMILARESQEPTVCIEREYLPSDTTGPHVIPVTTVILNNIVLTAEVVRASLSFGDLTNRKFPPKTYTTELFPMLSR